MYSYYLNNSVNNRGVYRQYIIASFVYMFFNSLSLIFNSLF